MPSHVVVASAGARSLTADVEVRQMKILTYNVNGLRPRVSQHGSLLRLLNSLDADIVCFQETKLSRQDLSVDLIMAEGYEAFVSCNRNSVKARLGYSGVATFCRVGSAFASSELALPLEAEEGVTGLLECPGKDVTSSFLLETPVIVEGLELTQPQLLKVDSEGRCIITDHGHFVLFNIYGPRAQEDDEERLQFKLIFFKILQKRWEILLAQGKRVFVVGDLNIAPAAIDRCDADRDFEKNIFRKWLRSMLRECRGPFFDVFRSKNPERKDAYTCFPQNIGAEEFNYGSRIDHVLIAGPCFHQPYNTEGHSLLNCHVDECDIMSQFRRGNFGNAPKWKGGRTTKLEGSDHVPVYVIFRDIPGVPLHNVPSLAVRYVPEVRGWQQTIVSFLVKGQTATCSAHCNSLNSMAIETSEVKASVVTNESCEIKSEQGIASGAFHYSLEQSPSQYSGYKLGTSGDRDLSIAFSKSRTSMSKDEKIRSLSLSTSKMKKTTRHSSSSQLSLKSFFKAPKMAVPVDQVISHNKDDMNMVEGVSYKTEQAIAEGSEETDAELNGEMIEVSKTSPDQEKAKTCFQENGEREKAAVLEWQRIQQKMKMTLPVCKGHGEPCVARSVKKEGANKGRLFYVCARAQGPASSLEANCGYFHWGPLKGKEKK